MFYCDECAEPRGWPTGTLMRSRGACEVCKTQADCNDTPSGRLPMNTPAAAASLPKELTLALKPLDPAATWRLSVARLMVKVTENQREITRSLLSFAQLQVAQSEAMDALSKAAAQFAATLDEMTEILDSEPKEATDVVA